MSYQPNSPDNQLQASANTNSAGSDNSDQTARPRRSWGTKLIIASLFLVVFGPLVYKWFPHEIALWHVAAAEEKYKADDVEGAIASLDKALEWDPTNSTVFVVRGTWKLMNADFAGSVDDFKLALELQPNSDQLLNTLAYSQALAKTDLEEALGHVIRALDLVGDNGAMLDTRGYIQLLLGNLSEARVDLDKSVNQVEQELTKSTNGSKVEITFQENSWTTWNH